MSRGISVEHYQGDGSDWDAFVACHPAASSYHQFFWRGVVEKSFGHKGCYLLARDGGGEPVGVLPLIHMKSRLFGNFLVSLPFFNYGGVLSHDPAAAEALLAEAGRVLKSCGASHVELRHLGKGLDGLPTKGHKVTMILDLAPDTETQWKAFNAKLRNQVRKAEKSGLEVVTGGKELLDGFYTVFCRNMRDLGTPVYGINFFANVLDASCENARIISVRHEGRTIASAVYTRFRDSVEVPWASSNRDYRDFCPNNMLYWEAISLAIREGARQFDFGRSTKDEGTYNFKKQWGAQPVQLHWQYLLKDGEALPELNPSNPKFRLAVKGWQMLPVPLTRLLGPKIVKNIP